MQIYVNHHHLLLLLLMVKVSTVLMVVVIDLLMVVVLRSYRRRGRDGLDFLLLHIGRAHGARTGPILFLLCLFSLTLHGALVLGNDTFK